MALADVSTIVPGTCSDLSAERMVRIPPPCSRAPGHRLKTFQNIRSRHPQTAGPHVRPNAATGFQTEPMSMGSGVHPNRYTPHVNQDRNVVSVYAK